MSGTGEDETREYIMSYYLVSDHPSRSTTGTPQGTVVADGELAAIRQALGGLIQEVRRRGLPHHIEGKAEALRDMICLLMVSDDYPDEWG